MKLMSSHDPDLTRLTPVFQPTVSMAVNRAHLRTVLIILVAGCVLLALLIATGIVTSPFTSSREDLYMLSSSASGAVGALATEMK